MTYTFFILSRKLPDSGQKRHCEPSLTQSTRACMFIFQMRELDYVSIRIRFSWNRDYNGSANGFNYIWSSFFPTE